MVNKYILISEIAIFLFLSICFISTIILYTNSQSLNFTYMKSLANNWETFPITDIYSPKNMTCNNGSYLISDLWPGTIQTCKYQNNLYKAGNCGKRSTQYDLIEPIPFKSWRKTFLCANRFNQGYLDLTTAEKSNLCPTGSKSCGIIDSSNNVLCYPQNKDCPINQIQIIKIDNNTKESNSIQLNDYNLIFDKTNKNGEILSNLIVNEGQPCLDTYYKNYDKPIFIAEKYSEFYKCENHYTEELYDKSVKLLDEYSFYDLYLDNNIIGLLNPLPTFSNFTNELQKSNRKFKLYSKTYIGIKTNCLKLIQENRLQSVIIQQLKEFDYYMTDSGNYLIIALVFGSIITTIYIILYPLFWIFKAFNDENVSRSICSLFHICLTPAYFITCGIFIGNASNIKSDFMILSKNDCFNDEFTSVFFKSAFSSYNSSYFASMISLIFSCLSVIIFIFMIVYSVIKDDEKDEKGDKDINEIKEGSDNNSIKMKDI